LASDTTGKYDKKFCIRDAVFFCGGIPVVSLAEPRSTTG